MPSTNDFRSAISSLFREAQSWGEPYVEINSGLLHRKLGGYPGPKAQMPSCCNVMYDEQKRGDVVISRPPKGKGASLTIRYRLPRSAATMPIGPPREIPPAEVIAPRLGSGIPNHIAASGVYVLTINDEVQYAGECANFAARFNAGYGNISPRNCFEKGQETNCRLNNLVYSTITAGETVTLCFFQTADYKRVEAELRSILRPVWNRI